MFFAPYEITISGSFCFVQCNPVSTCMLKCDLHFEINGNISKMWLGTTLFFIEF